MVDHQEHDGGLLLLALLSCVAGAATGLVVAMFRIALQHADHWRDAWIARAHVHGLAGYLLTVAAIAALTGLAARLVERFSPYAAGSGIPRVEAVAKGELSPAPFSLLPVKFFGGWLAIGGGLALGREGPSVQMGASIGSLVARKFHLKQDDHVALLAACGGAGLATAFNAPIAGAVFVLEELNSPIRHTYCHRGTRRLLLCYRRSAHLSRQRSRFSNRSAAVFRSGKWAALHRARCSGWFRRHGLQYRHRGRIESSGPYSVEAGLARRPDWGNSGNAGLVRSRACRRW